MPPQVLLHIFDVLLLMRLRNPFRREVIPSEHAAFLIIRNEYLNLSETIDLSILTEDSINSLLEFASELIEMQGMNTVEDIFLRLEELGEDVVDFDGNDEDEDAELNE